VVDSTDVLISVLGIGLGFMLYRHMLLRHNDALTVPLPLNNNKPVAKKMTSWSIPLLPVHIAITFSGLLGLSQISALPYNVRELFTAPLLASVCLTLSLYLMLLPAWFFYRRFALYTAVAVPLYVVQSLLIFTLLYSSLPAEAVYDITGTPVFDYAVLETWLRFAGVSLLFAFHLPSAYLLLQEREKLAHCLLWLLLSIPITLIWYFSVIYMAVTDNITELLHDGGSWLAVLAINLWFMLLCFSAAISAYALQHRRQYCWWLLPLSLLVLTLLSWLLLQLALEPIIVKYERVFSALQFLLSTERSELVSGSTLFIRHSIALCGLWLLCIWLYLALNLRQQPKPIVPTGHFFGAKKTLQ
jgi:hypothetical protein